MIRAMVYVMDNTIANFQEFMGQMQKMVFLTSRDTQGSISVVCDVLADFQEFIVPMQIMIFLHLRALRSPFPWSATVSDVLPAFQKSWCQWS